jgi:hypothetical protein
LILEIAFLSLWLLPVCRFPFFVLAGFPFAFIERQLRLQLARNPTRAQQGPFFGAFSSACSARGWGKQANEQQQAATDFPPNTD